MKRRYLSLTFALIFLLSLIGCGTEDPGSNTNANIRQGVWEFNPPQTMTQGQWERIEVRITSQEIGDLLTKDLKGRGLAQTEQIEVGKSMKVTLSSQDADAFTIQNLSSEQQIVEGVPYAQWEWNVLPLKSGSHELNLKAFIVVNNESKEFRDIPVKDRPIYVTVSYKYLFKKHWGFLVGGVALLGLLIGGWRFAVNRTAKNRELPPPVKAQPKTIRILYMSSNPSGTDPLRLDREYRTIDERLHAAKFRDLFDLRQQAATRVSDLQSALLRYQPDIVHFSGHGSADSEIVLEDNNGRSQVVPSKALSDLFAILRDNVRCVVLNACYSERQAQAIATHVECVVGMTKSVTDDAAINFAAAFYQALGYGRDVKTAFDLGCEQINLEDLEEEETPKLLAPNSDPRKVVFIQSTD